MGRWANEHKHAAAAILDRQTFYLDFEHTYRGIKDMDLVPNLSPQNMASVTIGKDFLLSHDYIKKDFDVQEWAAPEFLEQAARELLEEEWTKRTTSKLPKTTAPLVQYQAARLIRKGKNSYRSIQCRSIRGTLWINLRFMPRPAESTPYLGECGIEIKFIDGTSGEVVAEYTDTKIGKKYYVDTQKEPLTQVKNGVNGYSKNQGDKRHLSHGCRVIESDNKLSPAPQ